MQVKKQRQAVLKELEERKEITIYDVEYNMDEIDREILHYMQRQYPWVSEDVYEMVMDRLEKEHHYLQRVAVTKVPENDDLSEDCNICGDRETENDNFLVFCDGCNITVHQSCYGIPNIPEGSWLCRPCLLSPKKTIVCILCPVTGGAYKRTSNGFWCHVLCGMLVPGARFENVSLVEPVDIEDVHRSLQQCLLCSTKKGGVVPCAYYGCRRYYHATCAANSQRYIDLSNCILFCHEHDPQRKAESVLMRSPDENYPMLENPASIRKPVPLWIPQRRIHSEIESVPAKISDYVVNRIIERDIEGMQKAGACGYVKDMYAVWQTRKKDRPIIKRLRIDAAPEGFQRWGERRCAIGMDKKESKDMEEYALPEEIVLSEVERTLYVAVVEGTCVLVRALEEVKREEDAVKRSIREMEQRKAQMFSKYIPGYKKMGRLLSELVRADRHELFRERITDDIAPGYSSIILKPVSFDVIEERMESMKYKSFDEMAGDVDLLVSNAYKYNGKESFIGIEAQRIKEVLDPWKVRATDLVLARVLPMAYLPYTVVESAENLPEDVLRIRDPLTEETHLIERQNVLRVCSTIDMRKKIKELNEKTRATQKEEDMQNKYAEKIETKG